MGLRQGASSNKTAANWVLAAERSGLQPSVTISLFFSWLFLSCHYTRHPGLSKELESGIRKEEEVREIFSGDKRERGFSEQHSGCVEGGFKSLRSYLLVECSQMGGPNSIQYKPQTIAGWGWGDPWGGSAWRSRSPHSFPTKLCSVWDDTHHSGSVFPSKNHDYPKLGQIRDVHNLWQLSSLGRLQYSSTIRLSEPGNFANLMHANG